MGLSTGPASRQMGFSDPVRAANLADLPGGAGRQCAGEEKIFRKPFLLLPDLTNDHGVSFYRTI